MMNCRFYKCVLEVVNHDSREILPAIGVYKERRTYVYVVAICCKKLYKHYISFQYDFTKYKTKEKSVKFFGEH